MLYDELRNITATEVGTIVLHLIYIHIIEHGEGINKEVTATAGRVDKLDIEHTILLRMAHLLLRCIGYQILGLAGFLIDLQRTDNALFVRRSSPAIPCSFTNI